MTERATDKDILLEERAGDAPVSASSRSSSPSSSCVSSQTDSEDSDDETPPVDDEFAAGLEAMKARYDREHGIDRSLQARSSAGAPPMLIRSGRRGAVSIDTSEPIRDEARDKVRQAIVVSLGPENLIGRTMVEELGRVKTVQDLRDFTARNAHNLSELGQIQVEMQMSALGAWSRGFNALRGAMMFGRLEKGRQFDADGNEIQLTPEDIAIQKAEAAAREAAAAVEREQQETAMLEAEERARREKQERAARRCNLVRIVLICGAWTLCSVFPVVGGSLANRILRIGQSRTWDRSSIVIQYHSILPHFIAAFLGRGVVCAPGCARATSALLMADLEELIDFGSVTVRNDTHHTLTHTCARARARARRAQCQLGRRGVDGVRECDLWAPVCGCC